MFLYWRRRFGVALKHYVDRLVDEQTKESNSIIITITSSFKSFLSASFLL